MKFEINGQKYLSFYGGPFSQWFEAPESFFEDGIEFNTAEKYMMYHKAKFFNDEEIAKKILREPDPSDVKKLGRKVKNFNEDEWDKVKMDIVTQGNYLKFTQIPMMKEEFEKFKDFKFVEGSPYDLIWGVGLASNDPKITDPKNWKGQNLLGICIERAFDKIKRGQENA